MKERISSLLMREGFGTRKQCMRLISKGKVYLGSTLVKNPHATVKLEHINKTSTTNSSAKRSIITPIEFRVQIDNDPHSQNSFPYRSQLYLALNKPLGFECSHKPDAGTSNKSVFSLLPQRFITRGVQAAGRLDVDATGLLLMSDDGKFIDHVANPARKITKLYRVLAKHPVSDEQIEAMVKGVQLIEEGVREETLTRAVHARRIDEYQYEIVLSEGKYHQVKRMLAAVGNRVVSLQRIGIGNIMLQLSEQQQQQPPAAAAAATTTTTTVSHHPTATASQQHSTSISTSTAAVVSSPSSSTTTISDAVNVLNLAQGEWTYLTEDHLATLNYVPPKDYYLQPTQIIS